MVYECSMVQRGSQRYPQKSKRYQKDVEAFGMELESNLEAASLTYIVHICILWGMIVFVIMELPLASSSSAGSLLLDVGISYCTSFNSIIGNSHPATISHLKKIVVPPGLKASCLTFISSRSPIKNTSPPTCP